MLIGTSDSAIGIIQDAKTPTPGADMANHIRIRILTTPNAMFSTGTHTAQRNPTNTLSCNEKMHQITVAAQNHAMATRLDRRKANSGAHVPMPSTNTPLARIAVPALRKYDQRTSALVALPILGM